MHFLVRTLQSETSDTDLRLVVEFERSRYMVNCGEGSTRTSGQRREKTKNMRAIFLTRVDSDTSAGLPGWIMTQADGAATHPSNPPYVIDLVAPPPILPFLATARRYTNRPNVDLRLRALPHPPPAAAAAAPGQAAPSPAQGAREQGPNPPASAQHPPEPVYQDEYLTAYAACVLPSSFSFSVPVPASSGPGRASTGTGTGTGSKRLHQEMAMASDLEAARRELGRLGKELDEPDEPDALDELPEAGEVAGVAEVAQVADDEMDAGVPAGTAAGATAGEVDGAVGDGVGDGAEGERRVKRRPSSSLFLLLALRTGSLRLLLLPLPMLSTRPPLPPAPQWTKTRARPRRSSAPGPTRGSPRRA
ncbi:hypothetical protein CALCODRAFT_346889 [Calocera cornea HHB12733]|uniref:ribonuclease Z n=1 Tax=Calocera cornea HHB12733 TaxID=1353952 RepID=A0A165JC93_9BASI|nr:hypothetical protein CALCODRAFT_346889 [Calocera cornea HHB12733]